MKSRLSGSTHDWNDLLRSICQAIYAVTDGQCFYWVDIRKVEDRLGVSTAHLRIALEVGEGRSMLLHDGEPIARVALNPSGATMIKRRLLKAQRAAAKSTGSQKG
jgi:hypothetical protein